MYEVHIMYIHVLTTVFVLLVATNLHVIINSQISSDSLVARQAFTMHTFVVESTSYMYMSVAVSSNKVVASQRQDPACTFRHELNLVPDVQDIILCQLAEMYTECVT